MMELKKGAKALLLTLLVCSCAKIKVTTPSSRFISPETQGKLLSGSVRVEQQGGTEGTLSFENDQTDNPLELRNNVTPIATSLDLGILENLDLVVKGNGDAAAVYMLKYQIMGKNAQEASAGNQSLAVGIGYGLQEESQSDSGSTFNDVSGDISSSIKQSILDMTLIYGYRPHEDTLLYASVQALKQSFSFHLDADDTPALDGEKFELDTWAYGMALGATRYWEKYYFSMELSAQRTDYTNNDPTTFGFFSVALGYKWN